LEEEVWRKEEEEAQSREKECQRELVYRLEADRVTAVEQQHHKN